jgi:hypothetical protein
VTGPAEADLPQISSELFEAIGKVTVYATALEWNLAYLAALALDKDDEWLRQCVAGTGKARREFVAVATHIERDESAGTDLRGQIASLRQAANAVLDDRHVLVHSVVFHSFKVGGPIPALTWWNPRSDAEAELTVDQVRDHVRDLEVTRAKAVKVSTPVLKWRLQAGADQMRTGDDE